jgi:hypothetical protein
MDTAIVVISTLVAVGASLYMFAMNNIKDLKNNWAEYRCNPAYMPLAGLVGQDPFKNFNDCTMKSFQDYTGFVVDPIMSQFSTMTSIVSQIGGSIDSMRKMMAETRDGFLGIVGTVFGKIQNLMSQFQYIIIRMRTLMARLVGIMMSFVYIFTTGSQTGSSVLNGPIGRTMNFLCFDEDTLIKNGYGSMVYMRNLKLGDSLPNSNYVTSIYTIDGTNVPMFVLGNTKVSGGHKVWYKDAFIPVAHHPDAVPTSDSKKLVCINTHLRSFVVGTHIFMDFKELGTVFGIVGTTTVSGSLPIAEVRVGDILEDDVVCGTVTHLIEGMPVMYNLITYSSLTTPNVEKF